MWRIVRGWVVVAAMLAPLASATQPRHIAPPKRIPEPVPALSDSGDPVAIASLPRELRRAVVSDAAKRLGVTESAVVLTRAEQVTWSDGAMGCPKPGQMYTQALVSGYRIVAKTASAEIVYHTDSRSHVVPCSGATKPVAGDESDPRTQPPVRTPPDR